MRWTMVGLEICEADDELTWYALHHRIDVRDHLQGWQWHSCNQPEKRRENGRGLITVPEPDQSLSQADAKVVQVAEAAKSAELSLHRPPAGADLGSVAVEAARHGPGRQSIVAHHTTTGDRRQVGLTVEVLAGVLPYLGQREHVIGNVYVA